MVTSEISTRDLDADLGYGPRPEPWEIGYPYSAGSGMPFLSVPAWPEFIDWSATMEGTNWYWQRLIAEEQWSEFYKRGFTTELFRYYQDLFKELGISNFVIKNYFQICADFYKNALMGEPPGITGDNEVLASYLAKLTPDIYDVMEDMALMHSVKDRMVGMVDEFGMMESVDPSYYWPIRSRWNPRKTVGHLLAYAWHEPNQAEDYRAILAPNFIKFVRYDPEGLVDGNGVAINDVSVHQMHGNVVGQMAMPGGLEVPAQGTVAWLGGEGDGLSIFAQIATLVRALIIREAGDQRVLDKSGDPILWVPLGSFDPGRKLNPIESTTQKAQSAIIERIDGVRVMLGLREEDQPAQYIQAELEGVVISRQTAEELKEDIHLLSGVPKMMLGFDVAKNATGAAQEPLTFAAHANVNRARRRLERITRAMIDALPDRPAGEVLIEWTEDPFVSKTVRRQQALQEFQADLFDRVTTLMRMGLELEAAEAIDKAVMEEAEQRATWEGAGNAPTQGPANSTDAK